MLEDLKEPVTKLKEDILAVWGRLCLVDIGQNEEEHDVEDYRHEDVEEFQGSELYRALLISEVCERYALECIDGNGNRHHPYIRLVVGIAHKGGYGIDEEQHEGYEHQ